MKTGARTWSMTTAGRRQLAGGLVAAHMSPRRSTHAGIGVPAVRREGVPADLDEQPPESLVKVGGC